MFSPIPTRLAVLASELADITQDLEMDLPFLYRTGYEATTGTQAVDTLNQAHELLMQVHAALRNVLTEAPEEPTVHV